MEGNTGTPRLPAELIQIIASYLCFSLGDPSLFSDFVHYSLVCKRFYALTLEPLRSTLGGLPFIPVNTQLAAPEVPAEALRIVPTDKPFVPEFALTRHVYVSFLKGWFAQTGDAHVYLFYSTASHKTHGMHQVWHLKNARAKIPNDKSETELDFIDLKEQDNIIGLLRRGTECWLTTETTYSFGQLHGYEITFQDQTSKHSETVKRFKNGQLDGPLESWGMRGSKKACFPHKGGYRDGWSGISIV